MPYRRTPQIAARMQAQRMAITAAAADLLAEGGYAACTVVAVAGRAGVASGTVYNHFSGKAELAVEVFRSLVEREVDAVRRAAAGPGDAARRTSAAAETFATRALRRPRQAYALLAEPVDPAVDALRLTFRRAFRDVFAAAIEDGVRAGELPPQDSVVVAAALVGAIAEALVGPLADDRPADAGPAVTALLDFTHRAIGGRALAHA